MAHHDRRIIGVSFAILWVNLAVAAGKLVYGSALGSVAIKADGFHSLLDAINNVVIIVAVSIAGRPPDANHPYGHRKFEVLASLFIGFLFVMLIARTVTDAFSSLLGGEAQVLATEAYAVVLVTIAINVVVTVGEHIAGKRLESDALIADAKHTLSDVVVSLAVLGGIALNRRGVPGADAIAGLVVAAVIAWAGYGIVRKAIAGLADEAVLPEAIVRSEALALAGVDAIEHVRSRRYGREIKVDVVIKVAGGMTVVASHAIADAVEAAIRKRWADVTDVVVHVEPVKTTGS